MAEPRWGRTLLVANPHAHSGEGAEAAAHVEDLLASAGDLVSTLDVAHTHEPGDGALLAERIASYDTVLVLGGDGVIHDVACGLMTLDPLARPRIGIVPFGTGNDYARTLAIPFERVDDSMAALRGGMDRLVDVGRVNDTYFVETLSFGYDAAIALDTSKRRAEGSRQKSSGLFVTSGMRIFSEHAEGWDFHALFDGAEGTSGNEVIFAVQVGPTYGGGFRICPKSDPTDGLLDICYNVLLPKTPTTLILFGLARGGLHVGAKSVRLRRARSVRLTFRDRPPAQVDGEPILDTDFEISCVPKALRVIVPDAADF